MQEIEGPIMLEDVLKMECYQIWVTSGSHKITSDMHNRSSLLITGLPNKVHNPISIIDKAAKQRVIECNMALRKDD